MHVIMREWPVYDRMIQGYCRAHVFDGWFVFAVFVQTLTQKYTSALAVVRKTKKLRRHSNGCLVTVPAVNALYTSRPMKTRRPWAL